MPPASPSVLAGWDSFYVIVGSCGGALIGLQFVVITLIADKRIRRRTSADALSAFGTPTVVHFTAALIVSALMSVPWRSLVALSIALAICGFGGLAYALNAVRRARRQTDYEPVWQDWVWYAALPCGGYTSLAAGAIMLNTNPSAGIVGVGAAALGLLLIGIHNAWDSVTHLVVTASEDEAEKEN